MTNKVEAQPRKVNKKNHVVEPIHNVDVKQSKLNSNFELICATCKKSMFNGVHDTCLLDFVENVNSRAKSTKKHKKQKNWKPTGHVFTEVGLKWKPTDRTFNIVGNSCPLTRITSANVVPPKRTTSQLVETQKPELKVYSKKPKNVKNVGSSKKANIVEYKNVNHSKPDNAWGSNATDIPLSSSLVMTVRLRNDHIAMIMGYGDYQLRNVTISRVYYVEGLGHNLFSIGQFCDAYPKVAFRKNTCFIRNLEGKSRKSSHQPKAEDTNQEKLYLLHMDLCGPIHVASINGKRYILVIVDDYLGFNWVGFLRTKDEAPKAIIKCIKNIQVHLNATIRNVRIDNETEFVNQTLREFNENVGISHQTSVARTPQQNDVVKRRNRTLIEAARTMLIFSKATLFLSVEAINTTCYTQNRFLIRLQYNKTTYELMQDKKLDLSFFHVFGSLCYPTNDNDDRGKLDAKSDIGIFVGYAPAKKAFRIYNKRTWTIIEAIHVTFDELTAMASGQLGSGPGLQCMTPITSSSRLVPNPILQQPFAATPRVVDLADSPVFTSIDQDAPSASIPSIQDQKHSLIISQGFEESPKTLHFHDDPLLESLHEDSTSQGSSSNDNPSHVYKLKKALYGLKQALRACMSLTAYADADHVRCLDTRRGTSGSAQFLGDKLVSWSFKKQKSIAILSTLAKYIALSGAKHMDERYHFIKEKVENGIVELYFVWTEYQLDDIFIKPLPRERFNFLIEKLALPTDEEIVSFLRELGHTGEINSLNDVVVDHMHQSWRTFSALINKSLSGKTTGAIPLTKARKFKKIASPQLTTVLVSPEEPTKKSKRVKIFAKKSSKAPAGGVVIRETPKMPLSKKKEKSLRGFHKTHLSEPGNVTKTAPSAAKIKPSVTNEGTGVKPGVPDVTEEESSESEAGSWGNDEDESNNEQDSRSKGKNEEEIGDDEEEEEEEDEFVRTSSNDSDDETDIFDKAKGDEDEEMDYTTSQLYNDVDIRLNEQVDADEGLIQKEGTNDEMINVQRGNDNPEISQVIEDAHRKCLTSPPPSAIQRMVTESLDYAILAKESSQPQSSYEVTALLTEFKLKNVLINKIDKSESYLAALKHRRSQKDKDKDEDPSARSDRGLKKKKTSKDAELTKEFEVSDLDMPQDQEEKPGNDDEEPKKLDWDNPEGVDYSFDLTKPLPLVMNGNLKKMHSYSEASQRSSNSSEKLAEKDKRHQARKLPNPTSGKRTHTLHIKTLKDSFMLTPRISEWSTYQREDGVHWKRNELIS
uniref:Retrovirus-related Pol polyprotein from transposon TNT 1-94 n=1 Tax=Tanacetum cinerariifolium TaxID=118510 RepID=A0A699GHB3_TANCI|nr:retrovirus-related Pol polyprotein from transposon TNT 1-94 [Tanacetum cinerariifolium]